LGVLGLKDWQVRHGKGGGGPGPSRIGPNLESIEGARAARVYIRLIGLRSGFGVLTTENPKREGEELQHDWKMARHGVAARLAEPSEKLN